jgi:hypothetical protein
VQPIVPFGAEDPNYGVRPAVGGRDDRGTLGSQGAAPGRGERGRRGVDAGGRLFKTLGDAGLVAFPAELADAGVLALRAVQHEGDAWLARRGFKSRAIVKLHLGPVALGRVGSPGEEALDIYGKTVNTAATIPSTGLAMTPAVFRRLSPETRQLFKKHTPPITYIDAERRPA